MASAVDICNTALANLGEKANLSTITPPHANANAERCAIFYPIARDDALNRRAWSWAIERVELAATTPTVASGEYPYAFVLPSDCIRVLSIGVEETPDEQNDSLPRLLEGSVIRTTVDAVFLRYVKRVTNVNAFSPLFQRAVASLLSSHLAGALTKDPQVAEYWSTKYETVDLPAAAAADANNSKPTRNHIPTWMANR